MTEKFFRFKQSFSLEKYTELLEKKEAWFVTLTDEEYPKLLQEIANPPFVLFGKGNKSLLTESGKDTCIGVVGTRKVTSYGRQVTEMVTKHLVDAGFVIVSGLALGVDAIAHGTTTESNGKTIAVLGCGVDCCYPSANEKIYQTILENDGTIVSEFPLSMQPSVGSFPSRNRIIAGMSIATVVTEGAEDSGSLITAEDALSFGRKVFAVPGPITSHLSQGPLKLLEKGAEMVISGEDIISKLGVATTTSKNVPITGSTPEEQQIITLLENEDLTADEMVKRTKSTPSELSVLLSLMEIKGLIIKSETGMLTLNRS